MIFEQCNSFVFKLVRSVKLWTIFVSTVWTLWPFANLSKLADSWESMYMHKLSFWFLTWLLITLLWLGRVLARVGGVWIKNEQSRYKVKRVVGDVTNRSFFEVFYILDGALETLCTRFPKKYLQGILMRYLKKLLRKFSTIHCCNLPFKGKKKTNVLSSWSIDANERFKHSIFASISLFNNTLFNTARHILKCKKKRFDE